MIRLFPPLLLSLKETRLSPGSIFECRASLGNHGCIPVSNPCYFFFAVHTRCRHRFTLECHNPMLFLLPDTPHRIIPIPIPPYRLLIIFFTKGYQAYMHFLYLFLSFNKQLFQPLNFTFSCTLIAFMKGIFFDLRVKIIVLPLANYKSHRLLFLFHALPRIIVNAMNSARHPVDLHFVLLLML